jgi:hypothetical protein
MGREELAKFIEEKSKQEKEAPQIDWKEKEEKWLNYIEEFYNNVKGWLKDFEKKGIKYRFENITITEEKLGSYKVDKMILNIANEEVTFTPIGTILIAAYGRIDMKGKNGTVKFVLVDKESTGVQIKIYVGDEREEKKKETKSRKVNLEWKIATPPPSIKFISLDADTFSDYLLAVIG